MLILSHTADLRCDKNLATFFVKIIKLLTIFLAVLHYFHPENWSHRQIREKIILFILFDKNLSIISQDY